MPSIFETPREIIGARSIDPFSRQLAANGKLKGPVQVTAQTTGSNGRTKPIAALRVLVMEDDSVIGELLGEMLEGMGYDVCAIETTEADAILAAARCRPDLMIVDVQLGEGSGIAAVNTIRRRRSIPHVFVSGNIASIRALPPGSITIQKPYRESELAMVIQQALGSRPVL